jgi:hypothetical protein
LGSFQTFSKIHGIKCINDTGTWQKICCLFQLHWWQICDVGKFATGTASVVDTGGKFATGVNDTIVANLHIGVNKIRLFTL